MAGYSYNGSLLKPGINSDKESIEEDLFEFDYMPSLLKVWQVADILGVTIRTVTNYRQLGILPAVKVSKRKHLFRSSDVKNYITKRYVKDPFEE